MRPSGRLHIGNYKGALSNWLKLQEQAECFFMVADWHALTTDYENPSKIRFNTAEMVLDWLAAGLDPARCVIFRQSDIPQHAELALALSMITPLGWLERNPTYKEQLRELEGRDVSTYGFLGYPVLQAADILLYQADAVPVGEDQLPHLELSREIARRFNRLYGSLFAEPQALLTESPKIPGIDARKMSKSYGNTIELADPPEVLTKKIQQMFTDPTKIRATDKGHPEGCVVCAFHRLFNPDWTAQEAECREGRVGCVTRKKQLAQILTEALAPIRDKREEFSHPNNLVESVLKEGAEKARPIAQETLRRVKNAMGLGDADS
jgi:tryptophanyl-tRNA synthetase